MSRRRGEELEMLPHHVYLHFDKAGDVIYVGCTSDPENRPRDTRKRSWIKTESHRVEVSGPMPHAAAVWVEAQMIRHLNPKHNTQMPKPVRDELDWRAARMVEVEGCSRSDATWYVRYMPTDPGEFEAFLATRQEARAKYGNTA